MFIPWREFVPVKRARADSAAPNLDASKVRQLGLVLSRFEFNGAANPNYRPGRFSLKVLSYLDLQAMQHVHRTSLIDSRLQSLTGKGSTNANGLQLQCNHVLQSSGGV